MKTVFKTFLFIATLFVGLNSAWANETRDLNVHLNLVNSDQKNLELFETQLAENNQAIRQIVFEFENSNGAAAVTTWADISLSADETYRKTYPNGDFYYLIGNLDNDWTKSDYARFYSVAKWLAKRGFRTIINVIAFIPDLQEAVNNSRTSAIIWNSHGASNGEIEDSAKNAIPKNAFTKNRSSRLKYILFANCYGDVSRSYYGLKKLDNIVSAGWEGTVTSSDLFNYLFSEEFDGHLAKALGKSISEKSQREIKN